MLTRKWSLTILLVCALVFAVGAAAMAKSAIFWTAPNPSQEVFWHEMAKRFMAENPEYNIQILPMAEAPSSEATILTASLQAGQLQPPRRTSSSDSALNWCRARPSFL